MRISQLFTVPKDEKITEKSFSRVLISSVCSILLCMMCLAGTTWAWFAASVENTDNVIEIAYVSVDTTLKMGDVELAPVDGTYYTGAGQYTLTLRPTTNATDSQRTVYVVMTVTTDEGATTYYRAFAVGDDAATVALTLGKTAKVAFAAAWSQPEGTAMADAVTVGGSVAAPTTTTTTTATTTTTTVAEVTTTTTVGETTTTTVTEEE